MSKVFIIPDTHFPFHSKEGLRQILRLIATEKPSHVVQIGDLLDQYVFARFPKNPKITPGADVKFGLDTARNMWESVKKINPRIKCFQLLGNHDVRLSKRIAEKLPELMDFYSHKQLYRFDGVAVLSSDRDYITIDGINYVHGWLSKSIDHAKYFNRPTVHGHRHRPTIEYDRPDLWSMDVGFVADEKQLPLQYTASRFTRWTKACGIVEDGQPRLIKL